MMSAPYVPADLQTRLSVLFARMVARGMGESVTVYARTSVKNPSGRAVARQRVPVGTFLGFVASGGGASTTATEGQRESGTLECYFPLAALCVDGVTSVASLLNAGVTSDRWLVRAGDTAYWRITAYEQVGPYAWVSLSVGGTGDPAGNTK